MLPMATHGIVLQFFLYTCAGEQKMFIAGQQPIALQYKATQWGKMMPKWRTNVDAT